MASRKPRCCAKRMSAEMLCNLPYDLRVDYSARGQEGRVREVKIPGHFVAKIEAALRRAWAVGYAARMDQEAA